LKLGAQKNQPAGLVLIISIKVDKYLSCSLTYAATTAFLANLLFKFAALFLWIIPRLASLSIIEMTFGNPSV
jgi:hypothetical protein